MEIARESRSSTSASDSFAPSMRVEEPTLFDGRHLAECAEAVWRERLEGFPPSLELIDSSDEFHEVGADCELGLPHGQEFFTSDLTPNNTRFYPIMPHSERLSVGHGVPGSVLI